MIKLEKSDRWTMTIGAFCTFIMANVLMSGFSAIFMPNTKYPYSYSRDGLPTLALAKRLGEGWVYQNPRSGYPFGSNNLDYPIPDVGSLSVLKILVTLFRSPVAAVNIYFLLGFSLTFIASYAVLRKFDVNRLLSVVASTLFVFLPFHFLRLSHLFYTWYFVVPIYFLLAYRIYLGVGLVSQARLKSIEWVWLILLSLGVSSFGVYYTMFGMLTILVAGIIRSVEYRQISGFLNAIRISMMFFVSLVIFVIPNLVHQHLNGRNLDAAVRGPEGGEIYALKLTQLLLPKPDHIISFLGNITQQYNARFPLVNENSKVTLSLIGSLGFVFLLVRSIFRSGGSKKHSQIDLLAPVVIVLFLFGTIGGFGSLSTTIFLSYIRAWNRISIFIAFGSIAASVLVVQLLLNRFCSPARLRALMPLVASFLLVVGIVDQTSPPCLECQSDIGFAYEGDHAFVGELERILPQNSAVYQLPYMPYPEVPPLQNLETYAHLFGFIHSSHLRWSYGGMKGREGDLFFRELSKEDIVNQIKFVRNLGFEAVYINGRGYSDSGVEIMTQVTQILGKPILTHEDGRSAVYQISNASPVDLLRKSPQEIMDIANFVVDRFGVRYEASLAEGIDFSRATLPSFVKELIGLSGPEPWGRWSDANVGSSVEIVFKRNLPDRFTLEIDGGVFGPNIGAEMKVVLGSMTKVLRNHLPKLTVRLAVDLEGEKVSSIRIIPSQPVSPMELGVNSDTRKIAIGLSRLRIIEEFIDN